MNSDIRGMFKFIAGITIGIAAWEYLTATGKSKELTAILSEFIKPGIAKAPTAIPDKPEEDTDNGSLE